MSVLKIAISAPSATLITSEMPSRFLGARRSSASLSNARHPRLSAPPLHHHRHLVHEAEASLHAEIQHNADTLSGALKDLRKQQDALKKDLDVLNYIVKNHKAPENASMEIGASNRDLADVAWKTAQATAAVSYMPYPEVQEYAEIYSNQNELKTADQQAIRDAILSIAPLGNSQKSDPDPTGGHAEATREKIEILEGQLSLVEGILKLLDGQYKKFLSSHPA
ncbi:hypothetical protein [Edaphobacter modestus]|uniref:hypothetical protein n=1 Tax=Edaphobacter modestus TaxID=388466 RepID=UPI001F5FC0B3|nr:hypothetical protein [Edaphobacter modestus]